MKNKCEAWNAFYKDGSIATYLIYRACSTKNSCDGNGGYFNENERKGSGDTANSSR